MNSVTKLKTGRNPKQRGAAALRNMELLDSLAQTAINREEHLPGIVGFSGPSGFGKSTAAAYVAAEHQAFYIECRSTWTRRAFLENLIRLQGGDPRRVIHEMMDQVIEELAETRRLLIIDEFDHAIDRGCIELVRDIYEQARSPILIIGEERMPMKLKKWERFDGRILDWGQAQPADINDAQALNQHYTPDIIIADDLLEKLVELAHGSVRRIVTNLDRIAALARVQDVKKIDLKTWGDNPLYTGQAPKVREW